MSDADLLQRADLLAISIARDSAAFATRAVDAPRIALMTDARDAFDDYPTDVELLGDVSDKTQTKDGIRRNVEIAVRTIRNMAEIQFKDLRKYKTFGFEGITELTDNDLYRATKRVLRVATANKTALANQGLTDANLAAFTTLNTSFDDAIDTAHEAVELRDVATQERITLGNELWKNMSELASIGKSLFADTDPARYNDYVLNDSPSAPAGPTVYTGTVPGEADLTIATVTYKAGRGITFTNTGDSTMELSLRVVADAPSGTPVQLSPGGVQMRTMADLNGNPAATILVMTNLLESMGTYSVSVGG